MINLLMVTINHQALNYQIILLLALGYLRGRDYLRRGELRVMDNKNNSLLLAPV